MALVPRRLCAPSRNPWVPEDLKPHISEALDWQMVGAEPERQGMAGYSAKAPEALERGYELAGLQGAIGEQLAVCCTLVYELGCWDASKGETNSVDPAREMAIRALLDLLAFYLVSIGHGLANVIVRVLALHPDIRGQLESRFRTTFPPFDEGRRSWLSLGDKFIQEMTEVSVGIPQAEGLLPPLRELVFESSWTEVTKSRAEAFHRWRPQSAGVAGTPKRKWGVKEGGSIRYSRSGTITPLTSEDGVDAERTRLVLRATLDSVAGLMHNLDIALSNALSAFTGSTFSPNAHRRTASEPDRTVRLGEANDAD